MMNISRIHEAYGVNQMQLNRANQAYKYSAEPVCRTCSELSINRMANISIISTDEGLLPFNLEIKYCPTCGRKISYGRCKRAEKGEAQES